MLNQSNSSQNPQLPTAPPVTASGADSSHSKTAQNSQILVDDRRLGNRGDSPSFQSGEIGDKTLSGKALAGYEERQNRANNLDRISLDRLYMQREISADILRDSRKKISLSLCNMYPAKGRDGYKDISLIRDNKGKVEVLHLAGCNCLDCAVCGPKKAKRVESNVNAVFDKAIEEDLQLLFMTLTVRHTAKDSYEDTVYLLTEALKQTRKNSTLKRYLDNTLGKVEGMGLYKGERRDAIGYFQTLETTFGKCGMHPHIHLVFLGKNKIDKQTEKEIKKRFLAVFNKCFNKLSGKSLSSNAVDVKAVSDPVTAKGKVAKYLLKQGFTKELTASVNKNQLNLNFEENSFNEYEAERQAVIIQEIENHLKDNSITVFGVLDLCVFYKNLMENEAFKEYASQNFLKWKNVYQQIIKALDGVTRHRFSVGLKSWAGLDEDEIEDEDSEETLSEEPLVEEINCVINDGTWRVLNEFKKVYQLKKIARLHTIGNDDMKSILLDLAYISFFQISNEKRRDLLNEYIAKTLAEKRHVKYDFSAYSFISYGLPRIIFPEKTKPQLMQMNDGKFKVWNNQEEHYFSTYQEALEKFNRIQ